MEIFIGILVFAFVVQMILSLKAKRVVVRCIPAFVVLALMVASFLAYALSGWTNWAWLILMLLEVGILVPIALGAVLGGIARKVKNNSAV